MAKAIITLEDNGTDDVQVKLSFEPALSDDHASHRLAAVALKFMQEQAGEDDGGGE